jgi:hypothetical protein
MLMQFRARPDRRRAARRLGFVALIAAVGLALIVPPASASETPGPTKADPLRILFMGDSLAYEARYYFDFVVGYSGRANVEDSMVYGGTAICDWLEKLPLKLAQFRPDIAVVEFAGNNFTDCMRDPSTGQGYTGFPLVKKYLDDANAAMKTFKKFNVSVYWVNPPESCKTRDRPLTSVFIRMASRWSNADYLDTNSVLVPNGDCARYLPCLDGEPCTAIDPSTGQRAAVVRAPDGRHFCPDGGEAVAGVTSTCDEWSSGAYRYATAVAVPIIQQYDLTRSTEPLVPPPSALPAVPGRTHRPQSALGSSLS